MNGMYNILVYLDKYELWWKSLSEVRRMMHALSSKLITDKVNVKIHGKKMIMNKGYAYPFFSRRYMNYNNPFVGCIKFIAGHRKTKINLVDVGAAIGDTYMLAKSNCSNDIDKYLCVEGSKDFFNMLSFNLANENVILENAMLSDEVGNIVSSLVNHHPGSAMAIGDKKVSSTTLDSLLDYHRFKADLIKIDVDGFDGKVIAGSKLILGSSNPLVIFEWHPLLLNRCGNELFQPFNELKDAGYNMFVLYDKYGNLSHIRTSEDLNSISIEADICIDDIAEQERHYDVIASKDLDNNSILEMIKTIAKYEKESRY
jgi:FkbM family methyltransferase